MFGVFRLVVTYLARLLAAQAPRSRQVLDELRDQEKFLVVLDGRVFATTHCAESNDRGTDGGYLPRVRGGYSAHQHRHGAGARFPTDAAGHPL
ncbi:hypothetical protein ABH917_001104 [Thermobifida halotolerans]